MTLRFFNTLTRQKDDFTPIDPKAVRLYVCGPTVYDFAHIGNARPVIVFDVLFRLLRHVYGAEHVIYARNVTDVDDKINARAARDFPDLPHNEAIARVTAETERQFHEDVAALGCLPPTVEPRATGHIAQMRAMIERLIARGVAYVAEDHVLFSPTAMDARPNAPRYGALARRSLDEMLAGARVDVAPYKRDPMDFVLWKPSKPNEPGWPSPAGIATPGRPGWHIECSAMSMAELLEPFGGGLACDDPALNTFDIHGGGVDLVFPHHENEIAQSCCAFGSQRMANFWMHNGFLQVEGEKMSKSLGNFVTIRELFATATFGGRSWPGAVSRLAMLRAHYRQPIDWTVRALEGASRRFCVSPRRSSSPGRRRPRLPRTRGRTGGRSQYARRDRASARATGKQRGSTASRRHPISRPRSGEPRRAARGAAREDRRHRTPGRRARRGAQPPRLGCLRRDARRACNAWGYGEGQQGRLDLGVRPMSEVSLRPYVATDAHRCAEIFRASIEELAADDYNSEQREAWASRANDEAGFGKSLAGMLTLVALIDGEEAGFASLKGPDVIHMLFVAPEFARRGAGATLVDALMKLAAARGATRLSVEASEVAKPLFEKLASSSERNREMPSMSTATHSSRSATTPSAGTATRGTAPSRGPSSRTARSPASGRSSRSRRTCGSGRRRAIRSRLTSDSSTAFRGTAASGSCSPTIRSATGSTRRRSSSRTSTATEGSSRPTTRAGPRSTSTS